MNIKSEILMQLKCFPFPFRDILTDSVSNPLFDTNIMSNQNKSNVPISKWVNSCQSIPLHLIY